MNGPMTSTKRRVTCPCSTNHGTWTEKSLIQSNLIVDYTSLTAVTKRLYILIRTVEVVAMTYWLCKWGYGAVTWHVALYWWAIGKHEVTAGSRGGLFVIGVKGHQWLVAWEVSKSTPNEIIVSFPVDHIQRRVLIERRSTDSDDSFTTFRLERNGRFIFT